jgi:FixJ family two-component response regulator
MSVTDRPPRAAVSPPDSWAAGELTQPVSVEAACAVAEARLQELLGDLLVTDVSMPGMLGTELARTVAAARPGLAVLFVSGYADATVMGPGWHDRGAGFLAKPYSRESDALATRREGR